MYMDHLLDLEMCVAEKNKIRSVESLERSTRGIVTNARQRKPLLFKQTLRTSKVTSHIITSL